MTADAAPDPFTDLDAFVRLSRLEGLWLSPDGRRLVVGVGAPERPRGGNRPGVWGGGPDGGRIRRGVGGGRPGRRAGGGAAAPQPPGGDGGRFHAVRRSAVHLGPA